jgi:hypothetical protein
VLTCYFTPARVQKSAELVTFGIPPPVDGMITAVSLRRVYLIPDRLLDWLLLLGATSSAT